MSIGFIFWLLMLLWLIFGTYVYWPKDRTAVGFGPLGGAWLVFILLFLLGWKVFGFIIQG